MPENEYSINQNKFCQHIVLHDDGYIVCHGKNSNDDEEMASRVCILLNHWANVDIQCQACNEEKSITTYCQNGCDKIMVKTSKIDAVIRNIKCEQYNSCLDDSVANVLIKQLEDLKKV